MAMFDSDIDEHQMVRILTVWIDHHLDPGLNDQVDIEHRLILETAPLALLRQFAGWHHHQRLEDLVRRWEMMPTGASDR